MTKTLTAPAAPKAKDVMYTEKSDILKRIRKATEEAIRTGVPVTLANEVMTLDKVEDLLSINEKNRHKSNEKASDHGYKMKTGKWKNFGDSLHIARPEGEKGIRLLNGQHRLNGFKEAAAAIEERNKELRKENQPEIVIMWNIVCGLDPKVMPVIDTQKRRTTGDWLHIEGYSNSNNLGGAIRLAILLQKGKVAGKISGDLVSTEDIQEFVSSKTRETRMVKYVTTAVSRYRNEAKFLSPSQWAALHYVLATRNEAESDEFIEKLVSNESISATSPRTSSVFHVRKILENIMPTQKVKGQPRSSTQDVLFRKFYHIYKAWNAFVAQRRVTERDLLLDKDDKASSTLPYPSK